MIVALFTKSKTLPIFLFFIGCFFISNAQEKNNGAHFILLEIPQFSEEKTIPMFHSLTSEIKDIHLVGYCKNLKVVCINVSDRLFSNHELLSNYLKSLNLEFYKKEEENFQMLIANCDKNNLILINDKGGLE